MEGGNSTRENERMKLDEVSKLINQVEANSKIGRSYPGSPSILHQRKEKKK